MKLKKQTLIFIVFISLISFLGCKNNIYKSNFPPKYDNSLSLYSHEKIDMKLGDKQPESDLYWFDGKLLKVEGKGFADTENYYERLPLRAKGKIPEGLWNLGKNTAGIYFRFVTNSKKLGAIWDGGEAMNHMAATGNCGLDLYAFKDGKWVYTGTGRPKKTKTTATISSNLSDKPTEYLLYLPLYANVTDFKIGIEKDSFIAKPKASIKTKPIVFYGTSITQGGCASRAGMAHPEILGRWLNMEVINLGFSGSGKMEPEMAEFISEIDAAVYVLECLPNMTNEMVAERIEPFVKTLRKHHPDTPIILSENCLYKTDNPQNVELKKVYEKLKAEKIINIYYKIGEPQLAGIENGTVDGVHPTDLGFLRIAKSYYPDLKKLLK